MYKEYDYIFKIVILGSSSVGKSSILRKFADDQFQSNYISTIGVDFRFKSITLNGKAIKLQIWDTAGQQRFKGLSASYYKGAHAVLIVYDKDNLKSLDQIKNYWLKQLNDHMQNKGNMFVFANKYDDEKQKLRTEQILYFKQRNIKVFKVSAKVGNSVREAIEQVTIELMSVFPPAQKKLSLILSDQVRQAELKQKKCC